MNDDTLSVLIPARNEMFLARTIQDLLENIRGNTDIIAVLDGEWADPPVEDNERVTLVYLPEPVGQRAATNIAARVSQSKYVMKADAHCAFDEGFDIKLMSVMQPDWTLVPTMRNLHIFNWACKNGHTRYQGPSGKCQECGEPTTMDMVWIPKRSPQSRSYCFDSEPHFQYFGEFNKRPEGQSADGLTESMSIQGSCFMLTREKYFELDICEEAFGVWGSQGIEVACKTWLSGGRVMIYHNTWYAHCFRTQGGDFGFPYSLSGRQVDHAKKYARELFFENKWHKQVRPLSWLVDRFYPVKGWSDDDVLRIREIGKSFSASSLRGSPRQSVTNPASPTITNNGEFMPSDTMSLSGIDARNTIPAEGIDNRKNELQMEGIATSPIIANDMIELGDSLPDSSRNRLDEKSVQQTVDTLSPPVVQNSPIPIRASSIASPNPTSGLGINPNSSDNLLENLGAESIHNKIVSSVHTHIIAQSNSPTKGVVYYTDNRLEEPIMQACQTQLLNSVNSHKIISVSLNPIDFGVNIHVDKERGYLTMFQQILAGLEANDADIIFFCEHDVLYNSSHFNFAPPRSDTFYYNQNVWKVDYGTGRALYYVCKQTLGLCAYRTLLTEHYRERVKRTEQAMNTMGGHEFNKFIRSQGFEPGSHHRHERVDDHPSDVWMSEVPIIDIRHGQNLTPSRWRQDQFRDQRNCQGWKEADEVPGWGDSQELMDKIKQGVLR